MSVETFAHPEWQTAVGAVALAASVSLGLARWIARRRRRRLLGVARAPASHLWQSDTALLCALLAIGAALLGPRIGERAVQMPSSGVDIVFLIDTSRSMAAQDVPPSRLDRAKRGALELLARLAPQDRAALGVFAGGGVLLAPLTPDRAALAELVEAIDTELFEPPASDLATGVRAALEAFEAGSERPRIVFVLSDGEDPARRRDVGAADATRAGVRVLVAALGTEAGSTLSDFGAPLRDANGSVVVTRRDATRLERLAGATDGAVFRGDAWGAFDFDRAAAAVRRDAGARPGDTVERRVPAVRVLPFAALAFALLLLEGLPRPRMPSRRSLAVPATAAALFMLGASEARGPSGAGPEAAIVALSLEGSLRGAPRDPRRLVELGLARLAAGQREEAARAFLAAGLYAEDPETARTAWYDLGVAALERGDFEAARDAFFDALAVDPGHRRSRFNLEWTLQALEIPMPPSAPSEDEEEKKATLGDPDEEPDESTPEEQPPEPEAPPVAPSLSEEARQRWLERVEDDPARALRAARPDANAHPRASGPAW